MLRLLLNIAVVLNPGEYSPEERARARRGMSGIYYYGLVLLACALVSIAVGAYLRLTVGAAPTEAVAAADFDPTDLQGRLKEVMLTGEVHWAEVTYVTFPTEMPILNSPRALVPLTATGWKEGDPMRILLHNAWLIQSNPDAYPDAWERIGVPRDRGPAPDVTALMNVYEPYMFKGSVPEVLRAAGLNVTDDVVMLDVSRRREERAAEIAQGYFSLAGILMILAVPFSALGWFARRSLNQGRRR